MTDCFDCKHIEIVDLEFLDKDTICVEASCPKHIVIEDFNKKCSLFEEVEE